MLKKPITYSGFDGEEYTEDFYFNMTKSELTELHLSTEGGLDQMLTKIINAKDVPGLSKFFKKIIAMSYGEKSADGKRFMKTDDAGRPLFDRFQQTNAYDNLFMELLTDDKAAADFINKIMPIELVKQVQKMEKDA